MATLTETAYYARKYIRFGAIGLVTFIILRIIFTIIVQFIVVRLPPRPLLPNNAYGKLTAITFSQTASPAAQLTFSLQTIEGTVPTASSAARVYFMPKNRANLLSLSRAQSLVGRIGFTTTPGQISKTFYRWVDLASPLRTIEMDIVSNQFSLKYLYPHDLTLFSERDIPDPIAARNEAVAFFQSLSINLGDIDTTGAKVQYLKLVGNELQPSTSQSQADGVQIDFFRKNYNGIPLVTDKPNVGNIQVILSGSRRSDRRILLAKYQYWPVDTSTTAIYKLKTSKEAYDELLAGHAYIAQLPNDPKQTQIPITNVYVALYDGSQPQYFLQPVFVFIGEGGFVAYVPAVAPPWTE